MATEILKDQRVYFGGYDLSGIMNSMGLEYGAEMQDDTVFGDDTRSRKGGLKTVAFQVEGFFDADPYDSNLFSNVGAVDIPVSFAAATTDGSVAYTFKAASGEYSPGGSVGDMFAFSAGGEASGSLIRGTSMANTTETTTGNGTGQQLGAVASGETLYASLHVLSASSADTLDVIVESDDNGSFTSAVTRITFDQATAISSQFKSAAGPITDDYFRVSWTIAGTDPSFQFVVVVGIL